MYIYRACLSHQDINHSLISVRKPLLLNSTVLPNTFSFLSFTSRSSSSPTKKNIYYLTQFLFLFLFHLSIYDIFIFFYWSDDKIFFYSIMV